MEMEDRNSYSRKRYWARLFADSSGDSDDDDHPPEHMVTSAKKSKVGVTGEGLQQPQEEELDVRSFCSKPPYKVSIRRHEEELERRRTLHVKKNANGCLDTVRLRIPVKVVKKDSRIVVNGLSTKSAPFKCPSPLSEDSDELITSSADKKGSHSATSSPHCSVGDIPGSSSETNASQEDDLNKDEKAISVPEAKEQSKNEAIPENKRVSGNLPTLLDDDVKNLFRNILESINTFGDRLVAALERSRERVY